MLECLRDSEFEPESKQAGQGYGPKRYKGQHAEKPPKGLLSIAIYFAIDDFFIHVTMLILIELLNLCFI